MCVFVTHLALTPTELFLSLRESQLSLWSHALKFIYIYTQLGSKYKNIFNNFSYCIWIVTGIPNDAHIVSISFIFIHWFKNYIRLKKIKNKVTFLAVILLQTLEKQISNGIRCYNAIILRWVYTYKWHPHYFYCISCSHLYKRYKKQVSRGNSKLK
jgi:hypothetical protein